MPVHGGRVSDCVRVLTRGLRVGDNPECVLVDPGRGVIDVCHLRGCRSHGRDKKISSLGGLRYGPTVALTSQT
jgi:hypothetical protein